MGSINISEAPKKLELYLSYADNHGNGNGQIDSLEEARRAVAECNAWDVSQMEDMRQYLFSKGFDTLERWPDRQYQYMRYRESRFSFGVSAKLGYEHFSKDFYVMDFLKTPVGSFGDGDGAQLADYIGNNIFSLGIDSRTVADFFRGWKGTASLDPKNSRQENASLLLTDYRDGAKFFGEKFPSAIEGLTDILMEKEMSPEARQRAIGTCAGHVLNMLADKNDGFSLLNSAINDAAFKVLAPENSLFSVLASFRLGNNGKLGLFGGFSPSIELKDAGISVTLWRSFVAGIKAETSSDTILGLRFKGSMSAGGLFFTGNTRIFAGPYTGYRAVLPQGAFSMPLFSAGVSLERAFNNFIVESLSMDTEVSSSVVPLALIFSLISSPEMKGALLDAAPGLGRYRLPPVELSTVFSYPFKLPVIGRVMARAVSSVNINSLRLTELTGKIETGTEASRFAGGAYFGVKSPFGINFKGRPFSFGLIFTYTFQRDRQDVIDEMDDEFPGEGRKIAEHLIGNGYLTGKGGTGERFTDIRNTGSVSIRKADLLNMLKRYGFGEEVYNKEYKALLFKDVSSDDLVFRDNIEEVVLNIPHVFLREAIWEYLDKEQGVSLPDDLAGKEPSVKEYLVRTATSGSFSPWTAGVNLSHSLLSGLTGSISGGVTFAPGYSEKTNDLSVPGKVNPANYMKDHEDIVFEPPYNDPFTIGPAEKNRIRLLLVATPNDPELVTYRASIFRMAYKKEQFTGLVKDTEAFWSELKDKGYIDADGNATKKLAFLLRESESELSAEHVTTGSVERDRIVARVPEIKDRLFKFFVDPETAAMTFKEDAPALIRNDGMSENAKAYLLEKFDLARKRAVIKLLKYMPTMDTEVSDVTARTRFSKINPLAEVFWDCRDFSGKTVRPGIYFLGIKYDSEKENFAPFEIVYGGEK